MTFDSVIIVEGGTGGQAIAENPEFHCVQLGDS